MLSLNEKLFLGIKLSKDKSFDEGKLLFINITVKLKEKISLVQSSSPSFSRANQLHPIF